MSGFGYSDWSYDQFEEMVILPPDPLFIGIGYALTCFAFAPGISSMQTFCMGKHPMFYQTTFVFHDFFQIFFLQRIEMIELF